jgi:hypothetical protein
MGVREHETGQLIAGTSSRPARYTCIDPEATGGDDYEMLGALTHSVRSQPSDDATERKTDDIELRFCSDHGVDDLNQRVCKVFRVRRASERFRITESWKIWNHHPVPLRQAADVANPMSPTTAGTVHQKDNRSSSPAPTSNGPAVDVNIVAISDCVELINH